MRISALAITLLLPLPGMAQAKPEAPKPAEVITIDKALDGPLSIIEKEVVPLAEAMPEEKFAFLPATGEYKGVMNFGEMVKHIAGANYFMAAWILDEKAPAEADLGQKNAKTKAEIIQLLKNSYVYAHKAIASINDKNMLTPRSAPFGGGSSSRVTMGAFITSHGFDHYGQLVEYLRLNGIIPPASRK